MARAQVMPPSCCAMFQGLDMVPCLQDAGAGGNISGACCSSLNQALDAGRRCLCSLLLSSTGGGGARLLVGLAAALPLALALPGCLLYAPPLASCEVPVKEETDAPQAATASATTVDSPPPQAVVMSSSKKSKRSADRKKADRGMDGSADNSDGGADEKTASRSDARRRTNVGEGIRTYLPTFVVAMAAAFWFNYMIS
ncbi:hypothetical protein E2562_020117 [Oryza meyeriana var. granulata]|uniref:Bifunctional inhibitor/plant lipid transfer protein/seed storage helical domain-containing protein n=1 Tax=Oryza meyeriana var. granulata TaxID=110450 RepID=A0A6G1EBJ1_9ORYZ|nr:hypothetical protein E2562_020117 [Oryza meyeriana var. granulata]